MRFRLSHDYGVHKFVARNIMEGQMAARQWIYKNGIFPQRKKNYLYCHRYYRMAWNVPRPFWRWEELPF